MIKHSKRAQLSVYALSMLFVKAFFTIAAFLLTILIVLNGFKLSTGGRGADASIIAESLMHSPVLMMNDPITGRIYAGVVNETVFENETKAGLMLRDYMKMHPNVNYAGIKITASDSITKVSNSIYYNKEIYEEFLTYVEGDFTSGSGGYKDYNYIFFTSLGEHKRPGLLNFTIIIPNE